MIQILQDNHGLFLVGVSVLGLIMGSFLNVVIHRLPIMLQREWEKDCAEYFKNIAPVKYKIINLITPRSHCPKCSTPISWWQNIPVISYILLHGKCNHCENIIPSRYPLVELLSCLTAFLVALHFGISIKTFVLLILTWSLIAMVFIDLEHQLLPDNITLPLLWLGLLLNTNNVFVTPENAIIGAVSGYLCLWLIAYVFKLIRKVDGMGHGDFKLLSVFGAWLGWQVLPLILFGASLVGGIVGITLILSKKLQFTKPLAFGPYLAVVGWLAFFWGSDALNWYLRVFYL
jgi:leader peptidase (prepilin peptidase) / N-methyltransferase